jgi:hypothetical protein
LKSAANKFPLVLRGLGQCCHDGTLIETIYEKSLHYFAMAIENLDVSSFPIMGFMFENVKGI